MRKLDQQRYIVQPRVLRNLDWPSDLGVSQNVRLAIFFHVSQRGLQRLVGRRSVAILQPRIVSKDEARWVDRECEIEIGPLQIGVLLSHGECHVGVFKKQAGESFFYITQQTRDDEM